MYMCMLTCTYNLLQKYRQAILHHIDASRAYITLCAKHVTFKVFGSIFLITLSYMIASQDCTFQEECDCIVSYTQKQVCNLSHYTLSLHVGCRSV